MLVSVQKNTKIEFKNLKKTGYLVKLIGSSQEVSEKAGEILNGHKAVVLTVGDFLIFTNKKVLNSDFSKMRKSLNNIKKNFTIKNIENAGIKKDQDFSFQVKKKKTDKTNALAEVTISMSKDHHILISDCTPGIQQQDLFTMLLDEGYERVNQINQEGKGLLFMNSFIYNAQDGLQKLLGEPERDMTLAELVVFDKAAIKEISDIPALTSMDAFASVTSRALLNVDLIDRLLTSQEMDEQDMDRLQILLGDVNLLVMNEVDQPITVQSLVEALDASDTYLGTQYRKNPYEIVMPTLDPDTWEAFRNLFPPNTDYADSDAILFGAVDEKGQALGGAVMEQGATSFSVDWIYVHPEARHQGVGAFLINEMLSFMELTGAYQDFEVEYSSAEYEVGEFLLALGRFDVSRYAFDYCSDVATLMKSKIVQRLARTRNNVVHYFVMEENKRSKLLSYIANAGFIDMIDQSAWEDTLVKDLCFCKREAGAVKGAIFFRYMGERKLELFLLYSESTDTTQHLLAAACHTIAKKYQDYTIQFTPINESSNKLMQTLSPDFEEIGARYVASWNYK